MAAQDYNFTILNHVDSTNNYAMAKVHAGLAQHGNAYFTMNQTEGKGQRGKQWHSSNGENIAISIVIVPDWLDMNQQFLLSAVIAMACCQFYKKYAGDETTIKWPNDIYWRDRKAGGTLIENVIANTNKFDRPTPQWKYAVAGIGFNINQTHFDTFLNKAVSLKQITGNHFDLTELAKVLHQEIMNALEHSKSQNTSEIIAQYNACLFKKDEMVKLKKGSIIFSSTIKAVTENGQLYTVDTIDNFFDFGEVEWIL